MTSFLLDTNILIPVEDSRQTPEAYASLLHDIQAKKHQSFVHEASFIDVSRDKNEKRRSISLSKLRKYQKIKLSWRKFEDLAAEFGSIRGDNDVCDCHLLSAIKDSVCDFLVTEDNKLHVRARRHGLSDKVLYVRQALDLINGTYARVDYNLRSISRRFCYEINPQDPIFDSLRADYAPFDAWLEKCRMQKRECWTVEDGDTLAGIVIFNEETASQADAEGIGNHILKLCTFKISEKYRGGRLGEQMLRQALSYAFDSGYDSTYLTAYEKQISLREMLVYYGFKNVGRNKNGELIYAKLWDRSRPIDAGNLVTARRSYPQFPAAFPGGVIIPVQPRYHDRLFPEAANRLVGMPGDLFATAWSQGTAERSSPSNSILKAYLSYAKLGAIAPGSLAAFYRSTDPNFSVPTGITAVGIVESYSTVRNYSQAIELVAKRSVYSNEEIELLVWNRNLRVLRFLFYGYLNEPISRDELLSAAILSGPPQSFVSVAGDRLAALNRKICGNIIRG